MKSASSSNSLTARIRKIREGVRSGQPLDYRVALVRRHHRKKQQMAARAQAQRQQVRIGNGF